MATSPYNSSTGASGVSNATTQNSLASLLAVSDATNAFTSGQVKPVAQTATDASTYAWVAGWVVFIAILAVLAQTETGHNVIYYSLILIILVLVLTQYRRIVDLLAPVGTELPT
jgi:hypothetical protein